jgi:hypothetical protein
VEEGLIGEIEDPFEAVKWQQVLGGEGFLRKLKDHWNQRVDLAKRARVVFERLKRQVSGSLHLLDELPNGHLRGFVHVFGAKGGEPVK